MCKGFRVTVLVNENVFVILISLTVENRHNQLSWHRDFLKYFGYVCSVLV